MPLVGNMTVYPRGVGVSTTTSFPGPLSPWVGASGIPQLPYKNVDVYSDFRILPMIVRCLWPPRPLDGKLAVLRTTDSPVCHILPET